MFSIPCSVLAAATFSPAGFAVQIFSSEMGLYCARTFSSRCSSLSLIHLPLEPHVSFKSPLLSSPLFSFCSLALSKLQHSSLLPFHLSVLSTVCTQKREKIFLNLQMWKSFSESWVHHSQMAVSGWKLLQKRWDFIYLFTFAKILVNKCVSFEAKSINKRRFEVQSHTYCIPTRRKAVSVDVVLLIFHWRMKNKHFKWQKWFF